MSRKKKEKVILENVKIEAVAAEGKAIARVDGKVLFISNAIPGDIVDVQVFKNRKGYLEGRIINLIEPSPDRVEPFCSHFGLCGGCKWQLLPYSMQLQYKQQQVSDQFRRIGKLQFPELRPILGSEKTQYYRNKLEFTFTDKRWFFSNEDPDNMSYENHVGLGFHISGFFDKVLDIRHCYLQEEPSNEIRLFLKKFALDNSIPFYDLKQNEGCLRNIIIRTSSLGQVMVIMIFGNEDEQTRELVMNGLSKAFPSITSLYYVINTKLNNSVADLEAHFWSGEPAIYEGMEELRFRVGPRSFYQTNSDQAYRLYSIVRELADLKGNEVLYDLYTGTGTIALFLAKKASKVIGVEYVNEAVEDAKVNAEYNNVTNAQFFAGDMKKVLNAEFIRQHGRPDVMVLDPPRAGIDAPVAEVILEANPIKIVYVSCNPATQARDLAILSDKYDIKVVAPVDMFPHTHHVENVVLLEQKYK